MLTELDKKTDFENGEMPAVQKYEGVQQLAHLRCLVRDAG